MSLLLRLLLCWTLLVLTTACANPGEPVAAVDGTTDLRSWRPEQGPVRLTGEWKLAWEQLLQPAEVPEHAVGVEVPGPWHRSGPALDSRGYGTYRLQLQLPQPRPARLTLELRSIAGASRAWIDGVPLPLAGQVSGDPVQVAEDVRAVWTSFTPSADTVSLTVQVANQRHRSSGIRRAPVLGLPEQVDRWRQTQLILDLTAEVALATMASLFLLLFALRRSNQQHLVFALFCLVISLRQALAGPGEVGLALWPDMPWAPRLRIEYATIGVLVLLGVRYQDLELRKPPTGPSVLSRGLLGTAAVLTTACFVIPMRSFTTVLPLLQLLIVATLVREGARLAVNAQTGNRYATQLLAAFSLFALAVLHDILLALNLLRTPTELSTVGFMGVLFVQGLFVMENLARRVARTEEVAEHLRKRARPERVAAATPTPAEGPIEGLLLVRPTGEGRLLQKDLEVLLERYEATLDAHAEQHVEIRLPRHNALECAENLARGAGAPSVLVTLDEEQGANITDLLTASARWAVPLLVDRRLLPRTGFAARRLPRDELSSLELHEGLGVYAPEHRARLEITRARFTQAALALERGRTETAILSLLSCVKEVPEDEVAQRLLQRLRPSGGV